jgi:hypothetical protein
MGEYLKYLNDNAGAFNVLFTGVVALATAVYAVLTAKLVRETRNLREAQTEPRVEVFFRPRDEWISLIDIVVKNIGAGPAYDLRFESSAVVLNEASDALLKRLSEVNSIHSGIAYLGPGQEFSSYWTNMTEQFEKKIEARLVVKSSFRSATGHSYSRQHVIDLSELKGLEQIGEPPLLKIVKYVEKLQQDVQNLASGFKKLRVDIFDSDDRDTERKQREEERAKRVAQSKSE